MGATVLKQGRLETALVGRGLQGFQRRVEVELQPSGVGELDAVLGGGFPRGSLVELCGPASSGRTSLAFSLLAQATERQVGCAFVDVSDCLDPISLAAAGVELPRLLWIRCGEMGDRERDLKSSSYLAPADKKIRKTRSLDSANKKPVQVHGWRHPRELMRGVDKAIPGLVGKQAPFAESTQIHVVARCSGEQVERDREPPPRGFRPQRFLPSLRESNPPPPVQTGGRSVKPWKCLEQALKTTDLLLYGGGWGVVVVDLGGISWVDARRIELSTWFRFRRAIENTPTILLLLGEESCAKSCASLVLWCQRRADEWSRAAASAETGISTLEGFEVQGEVTRYKLREKEKGTGTATLGEVAEHTEGLVCLTGGAEGVLAASLSSKGFEDARKNIELLTTIFGRKNVYVELQRHCDVAEERRNQAAVQLARMLGLPVLATNGVRYATPAEREILDVFTCIRNHCKLETAGRLPEREDERHLRSTEEMVQLFSDLPEAIQNTSELSARLQYTLADLGYEFPRYPVPEGETMDSFLRKRTEEGSQNRYAVKRDEELFERAKRQVERELALIEKLHLAGYFLIVWDIIRFCREQNILVQGRGSAANSAVCYSLGITAVDPVGMELLFERFLSEERGEWPDIDLDLPSGDQRERVIQYLYKRYGERGAAMTANVITYRNRMAGREMGKALGFDPETLDKVSSAVSTWEYRDSHDRLDHRFHDAGLDLSHPRLRKYFELCEAVQDLPRHLGQHSGGMVICQGQLDSVVPLEPASMPGRVVVQWDKEDCADLGIIKVDLLGLGMMAVLEDSITLIRNHYGEEVDLAHLPADDPTVYSTLQKADTIGMFQVESRAQMSCLPRLRPKRFYDIVVQVAIIRPGPIVGQMVNPFLQRRLEREQVTYPHPSLEPVLKRTLGVPLFQEQLLRMAMVVAGFSGGEAEELRRAMGFNRSEKRMKEIEAKLRTGMERNGISREAQEQIVLSITSFALYGFPESHAASFALIAYASAYLKCHYLAAFTAALLNNQPMGFYRPATIVSDAEPPGVKMLPVDVTRSEWMCSLEAVASGQWPVASKTFRQ